jgi:hypothetical protein
LRSLSSATVINGEVFFKSIFLVILVYCCLRLVSIALLRRCNTTVGITSHYVQLNNIVFELHPKVLKEVREVIAKPMEILFEEESILSGVYPWIGDQETQLPISKEVQKL